MVLQPRPSLCGMERSYGPRCGQARNHGNACDHQIERPFFVLSQNERVSHSEGNKVPGIIGFPGMGPWRPSAASTVTNQKTTALESNHFEDGTPVFICPTLTQNTISVEAIWLGEICASCHRSPCRGISSNRLRGLSLGMIALSCKNDVARWMHEKRSRTGAPRSQESQRLQGSYCTNLHRYCRLLEKGSGKLTIPEALFVRRLPYSLILVRNPNAEETGSRTP
jgi:hypothetical protein